MRLFEIHNKGPVFYETKHKFLYHMTDHHGYAYTIDRDALRSLTGSHVSTTYDPNNNYIYGQNHADFKFVLNAKPLVSKYGGFEYDFHSRQSDGSFVSLDEREIGINTQSIEPFKPYLVGTVLLFGIFTRKAIQWLLYDNPERKHNYGKTAAPRAVEALYRQVMIWKRPIWIGAEVRKPTAKEVAFLKDAFRIHERGGNFKDGMLALTDKWPVVDHFGRMLDGRTVARLEQSEEIYGILNAYYRDRPYTEVDPDHVRRLFKRSLDVLGLNANITTTIMHEIEKHGLFHPVMEPVEWGVVIKNLMYGDVDSAIEDIEFYADKKKTAIARFNDDPGYYQSARHVGTMF